MDNSILANVLDRRNWECKKVY